MPEPAQLLAWVERLALPEQCQQEWQEIAASLKHALFQGLAHPHAPPVAFALRDGAGFLEP